MNFYVRKISHSVKYGDFKEVQSCLRYTTDVYRYYSDYVDSKEQSRTSEHFCPCGWNGDSGVPRLNSTHYGYHTIRFVVLFLRSKLTKDQRNYLHSRNAVSFVEN